MKRERERYSLMNDYEENTTIYRLSKVQTWPKAQLEGSYTVDIISAQLKIRKNLKIFLIKRKREKRKKKPSEKIGQNSETNEIHAQNSHVGSGRERER